MDHGQRAAHELSRFWDTLIQDETTAPPLSGLETELTETVRWLHRHRPGAAPDAVRERIWRQLAHQASHDAPVTEPLPPPALFTSTGSDLPANGLLASPHALEHKPRIMRPIGRWALTHFATAALLLLTLAVAFVALRQQTPEATPVPALIRALESIPEPEDVVDELMLEVTFSAKELPVGDTEIIFYRLTLDPGASLPSLAGPACACWGELAKAGVGVEVVQSGVYALRLDAPIRVQRGVAARAVEEIGTRSEVILEPGDIAIYSDAVAPGDIQNAGDEPVVVIGMAIVAMEESAVPAPSFPTGIRFEHLTRTTTSEWQSLPAGPVSVSLWQVTLPEGTSLGPYEATGLETLRIERGAITRSFLRPGETASRGRPLFHLAGTSAPFMAPAPGVRRVIASAGDEPAVFLVLSIEPAGAWSRTLAP
jgi:hypothetical protein